MLNKAKVPLCTKELVDHLRQVFSRPIPGFDTTVEEYRWVSAQEEVFSYMEKIAAPNKTGVSGKVADILETTADDDGVVRWYR